MEELDLCPCVLPTLTVVLSQWLTKDVLWALQELVPSYRALEAGLGMGWKLPIFYCNLQTLCIYLCI